MRHIGLFEGIGGFSLAARWMGWETVAWCEWNKYCQSILTKLFPNADKLGDINKTDFTKYANTIDILTGGDPCQPSSVAGLGKGTTDDRYLWPQMFRSVREIQPPWLVNENVSGSIANGILDIKIDDLESIGYTCQAYRIPAESVGALHQRERVWLVAYNANFHRDIKITGSLCKSKEKKQPLERQQHKIYEPWEPVDLWAANSHPDTKRFQELNNATEPRILQERVSRYFGFGSDTHGNIPRYIIKSGIMGMLDGLPEGMDYVDRGKRIEALGNAIVPEVAFEIYKGIEQYQK